MLGLARAPFWARNSHGAGGTSLRLERWPEVPILARPPAQRVTAWDLRE